MAKLCTISLLLVAIAAQSQAFDFWNDFRVTWWPTPDAKYDRLPRNVVDATREGWVNATTEDCSNSGRFNGQRWFDPNDYGIGLLMDANGYVAGIQCFVPHDEMLQPNNTFRWENVPMIQNETRDGRDFFVITVYFIDPSLICTPTSTHRQNIGEGSQVYYQNGASPDLLRIAPKTRAEAIAQGWNANECVPGMGWHNFYKVDEYEEHDCKEVQPHSILFNENDELIGFTFSFTGVGSSSRFEHPSPAGVQAGLGPGAPACAVREAEDAGTTTMHVYFINTPWQLNCVR